MHYGLLEISRNLRNLSAPLNSSFSLAWAVGKECTNRRDLVTGLEFAIAAGLRIFAQGTGD